MIKILILVSSSLLLISCRGGGDSSSGSSAKDEVMEISKNYTLYTGNKISKMTQNAEVKVFHEDGKNTSSVTLLSGEANITRRP